MERTMSEAKFDDPVKHIDASIRDAKSTAAHAAKDTIPVFSEAARATADAWRAAGRKASAMMSDLGDAVPEKREEVARHVQSRPLTAVLVAAGVGLLAGLLLARR
jgi:ElaB/YqjD/DUF883 family membrane-anchored ribosome-binding protein